MASQEKVSGIALVAAAAGIVALIILAQSLEPRPVKIREIDRSFLEWPVSLDARVESSYMAGDTLLLTISDGTGEIRAVLFRASRQEQAMLCRKCFASIQGKVQLYEGSLEVVVERVEAWE